MPRRRALNTALTATVAALIGVAGAATATATGIGVPGGGRPVLVDRPYQTLEFSPTSVFGMVCPFPVTVADVAGDATEKHYPDGTVKGTGRLVIRVTNEATGVSVLRNISGPGTIYTDSAGLLHYILNGPSVTWVTEGKDATRTVEVGLYIRHGSVVYDGNLNLVSYTGSAENLCETLA
jgi:hypothetical protein